MSKLIVPPADNLPVFELEPPITVDADFLALLQQQEDAENEISSVAATKSWYRAGQGPRPQEGGVFLAGDTLLPLGTPPSGNISSIKFNYDRDGFGGWTNQITVMLYVKNIAGQILKQSDITSSGSGIVNCSGANIPANCRIVLAMKVGNLTGKLYKPPYINGYDCTVYYS